MWYKNCLDSGTRLLSSCLSRRRVSPPRSNEAMRNATKTPPHRKSVINLFHTPPLRRVSNFPSARNASSSKSGQAIPDSFPNLPASQCVQVAASPAIVRPYSSTAHAANWDEDDFDHDGDPHTLSAMGDISMSIPFYVPGETGGGMLSPPPLKRERSPNTTIRPFVHPERPRPPARRFTSFGVGSYKFRTLTLKGGPIATPAPGDCASSLNRGIERTNAWRSAATLDEETLRPSLTRKAITTPADTWVPSSNARCDTSCGSIDSELDLSTPQERFEAFMRSRDLTHSPEKKKTDAYSSVAERNRKLNDLAKEAASTLGREFTRPSKSISSKPLRGDAALPARLPLPDWATIDTN